MNTDVEQIVQSKEAERRRLRALPWWEKLEMLDKLRDRQLWLQKTRPLISTRSQVAPENG